MLQLQYILYNRLATVGPISHMKVYQKGYFVSMILRPFHLCMFIRLFNHLLVGGTVLMNYFKSSFPRRESNPDLLGESQIS